MEIVVSWPFLETWFLVSFVVGRTATGLSSLVVGVFLGLSIAISLCRVGPSNIVPSGGHAISFKAMLVFNVDFGTDFSIGFLVHFLSMRRSIILELSGDGSPTTGV